MSNEPTPDEIAIERAKLYPVPPRSDGTGASIDWMNRPLVTCFGVNVDGPHLQSAIDIGIRNFRVGIPWYVCDDGQQFNFEWAMPMMQGIDDCGGTALIVCYGTPQNLEPSWPRIPGWSLSDPGAIAIMRPEWIDRWKAFLDVLSNQWPEFTKMRRLYNIATETTDAKLWADPDHPDRNGGAQRYVDLVLKPAAEVLKPKGCRIVAAGTTMRGERQSTWMEGLSHVGTFMQHSDLFDLLDVHIYRESGADTVSDYLRILRALDGISINISETGFNIRDDAAQAQQYQLVLDFLEHSISSLPIECAYAYRWWGDPWGLLNEDGTLRQAGELIVSRLRED